MGAAAPGVTDWSTSVTPIPEKRDPNDPPKKTRAPTHCPSCKTRVERDEEEVAIYCPNVACPGPVRVFA